MEKVGRRSFFRLAMISLVGLFVFIWEMLIGDHREMMKQKISVLPFNKNKLISFTDDYLIVNHNEETIVFSAHCTHLGCIINKVENGKLVCPCHGSEYDLEGNVVKGPAWKSLKRNPSKITSDGTHIEIIG